MPIKFAKKFLLLAGICALLAVWGGCAGGSKGTGAVDYIGRVLTTDNAGISGAVVTIIASGASDLTDEDGSFAISSIGTYGDVDIMVDTSSFSGVVSLLNVPASAHLVQANLIVDEDEGRLEARDVEVDTDDSASGDDNDSGATPVPTVNRGTPGHDDGKSATPTSAATALPSASPAQTPDSAGDGHSSATPTPAGIASPTSLAGATPTQHESEDEQEGEDAEGEGRISAVTATTFTVQGVQFVYNSQTRFYDERGRAATSAILTVNNRVHAHGIWVSGQAVAQRVEETD